MHHRFSAASDRAGMKISTKNTELCLSTNPSQCTLQVNGNTFQQVEKIKYLGVLFTSDGRWSEDWYTDLQSKRSSEWASSLCSDKTGAFKHRKAVSFQVGLCSDPYLWSSILGKTQVGVSCKRQLLCGRSEINRWWVVVNRTRLIYRLLRQIQYALCILTALALRVQKTKTFKHPWALFSKRCLRHRCSHGGHKRSHKAVFAA